MWIDPGWLDYKNEIAAKRDAGRRDRWRAASILQRVWIWLNGDSPNGANHRRDWR